MAGPQFIGRDAVNRMQNETPDWSYWGFEIENSSADAMPSDPILLDGELAGYVTSASTGFRTGKRLALGYLQNDLGSEGKAFEIQILGKRCQAKCVAPHFYDPENARLKA